MLALLQLTESPSPSQVLGKKGRALWAPVVLLSEPVVEWVLPGSRAGISSFTESNSSKELRER